MICIYATILTNTFVILTMLFLLCMLGQYPDLWSMHAQDGIHIYIPPTCTYYMCIVEVSIINYGGMIILLTTGRVNVMYPI